MSNWQKIIKYSAITLAILIIIGIFSSIYLLGKVFFSFLDEGKECPQCATIISENYKVNNEIKKLEIDLAESQLTIEKGDTFEVLFDKELFKVRESFSKLSIKNKFHSFTKSSYSGFIIITVPETSEFNEVSLNIGEGEVEIDTLSTKELELELGTGKMTIDNLTVTREADMESGAGEVIINHSNITNLSLSSGVGKFTLNSSLLGNNEIEAGTGELNINLLDSKDNYRIRVEKEVGTIKVDGREVRNNSVLGNGKNKIDIEGGTGSTDIAFKQ